MRYEIWKIARGTDRFLEMKGKFSEIELECLLEKYNRHFGAIRMQNELTVLYSAPDVEICSSY